MSAPNIYDDPDFFAGYEECRRPPFMLLAADKR